MKNKEIKQIIFSQKKNKKWIIVALVLVLTLVAVLWQQWWYYIETAIGQNYPCRVIWRG